MEPTFARTTDTGPHSLTVLNPVRGYLSVESAPLNPIFLLFFQGHGSETVPP